MLPKDSPLDEALQLEAQGAERTAVEAAYRTALATEPHDAYAYYSFARFLLGVDSLGEAEALLEMAIALDPSYLAARSSLGYMLISRTAGYNTSRARQRQRRGLAILSHGILILQMVPKGAIRL